MFKKIMSVMLAIVMLMSVAMIASSAAQVEIADNSADAVADVAADGSADTGADGDVADTGSANVIHFDTAGCGWNNFDQIGCHIWAYGGDSFYAWGAKGQRATDEDGDGIWTYDLDAKGVTLESGQLYAVIFYSIIGGSPAMQTHNLLFDASVIGDTAYVDPNVVYENMEDSNKSSVGAFWRGQDPAVYGPEMGITSIGNVVGTCIPYTTSAQAMFETFLTETLENARTYSGKDDQTLLDDTAKPLGLKQDDVEAAIKNTGAKVEWDKSKSSLESGSNPNATDTPNGGNTGGGANTNNSNNSNKNTNSSTTKTGSGSTTKTGQESTILFIMLGVMLAAAGVVVLARKERA